MKKLNEIEVHQDISSDDHLGEIDFIIHCFLAAQKIYLEIPEAQLAYDPNCFLFEGWYHSCLTKLIIWSQALENGSSFNVTYGFSELRQCGLNAYASARILIDMVDPPYDGPLEPLELSEEDYYLANSW